MELSLGKNISRLRKANAMTQEQLAEALGVTFAAVSKWERGVATPELTLIAQMADLFGVSLDALVGFSVQNGNAVALEERVHALMRQKKYEEAVVEAKKALLRYPNDFRIVHRAGELYTVAGIEWQRPRYMRRGIELLEHATLLLSQNDDPKISQVSIQYKIAQCYIVLGETDRGTELLKKYNVSGVHNAIIAMNMTGSACRIPNSPELEEAVPFLNDAFLDIITNALRTMLAYVNYYYGKGDDAASRDAALWLIRLLESVKIDPDAACYVDKVIAPCYSECANFSLRLGETEKVEPYLRKAYQTAVTFDAAPTCKFENMKFCIGDIRQATAYDDIGQSAMESVWQQISQEDRAPQLREMWEKMLAEASGGGNK